MSVRYDRYISRSIRMMAERDSVTEEFFTDENLNSDSAGETENL